MGRSRAVRPAAPATASDREGLILKILVCHYSRTGTTRALAGLCAGLATEAGHEVCRQPLEPRLDLPYPLWLALSFVPGSRFPIRQTVAAPERFDACLLALPKWTFSCPPVNSFLATQGRRLPPTAVAITCGGWDQDRYLTALERRLRTLGVAVLGGLAVRKKRLAEEQTRALVADFLARCYREVPQRQPTKGSS